MSDERESGSPRAWATAKLGDIADVQLGKMLDAKRTAGTRLPYLRNVNVRWGHIDTADLLEMPFQDHELQRYAVTKGDVLVCEGGEPGRAAVWKHCGIEVKYQKALHRVRLHNGVTPSWLVYHLYLDAKTGRIGGHVTGSTIGHFTRESVIEYRIQVAPVAEQRRIIDAVDDYFSRLDDAVATLERVQRNLKRYRASVLKAAIEGRLVPTEAELARAEKRDYEPASELLKRILAERHRRWNGKSKYDEPAAPEVRKLPELPAGWCWATVEQLASDQPRSIQSGPFGSNLRHSEFQPSGRLVIGIDNVQDGYFSLGANHRISESKFLSLRKYEARPGDVLITVMATIGRCCVVPDDIERSIITKHVYRITPEERLVRPRYLLLALRGGIAVREQMFAQAQGQTRLGLNGTIIKRLAIPLPPPEEQARIIAEAERLLSLGDAAIKSIDGAAQYCSRLRQSILKWAFEGKLVDQDPNDEPASALLERIRAERSGATEKKTSTRRARQTARNA